MKIFKLQVEDIKDDDGKKMFPFTGTLEVEVPTYKARLDLIKKHGLYSSKDDNFEIGGKVLSVSLDHIKSVDLKLGAEALTSVEDLGYYKEGADLINHVGTLVISGFSAGN